MTGSSENNQLRMLIKRKKAIFHLTPNFPITIKDFLSLEMTKEITTKVYEKIDSVSKQTKLSKHYQHNFISMQKKLANLQKFYNCDVVVLHRYDRESGAIVTKLQYVLEYLDILMDFVGFKDGYRDIVVVDTNLKFGLCIERNEYHNYLIEWYE